VKVKKEKKETSAVKQNNLQPIFRVGGSKKTKMYFFTEYYPYNFNLNSV